MTPPEQRSIGAPKRQQAGSRQPLFSGPRSPAGPLLRLAVAAASPFVLIGCLAVVLAPPSSAMGQQAAEPAGSGGDRTPQQAEPQAPPPPSAEMIALGNNVRKALSYVASQPFNTGDHTPTEVLDFGLVFGCDAMIGHGRRPPQRISALGCLCWNYPCAGRRILRRSGDRPVARLGYGMQARPSQFLAVLAQSMVPADYEIRVGEFRGTVADLAESEKLDCRSGTDLSLKLIGLAFYADHQQSWNNDVGEDWSVQRLVREELGRSPALDDCDVTGQLMGLSYAVRRRVEKELPVEGVFLEAREHVGKYHGKAFARQSADGTWPSFFAEKPDRRDAMEVFRSTGHVLEWLVFSLPEERLRDPRVVRSVAYVTGVIRNPRSGWNLASMSTRDIAVMMRAAHALAIYDRRVFRPLDAEGQTPG